MLHELPLFGLGFANLLMLGWLGAAAAPIVIHLWSKRRYREAPGQQRQRECPRVVGQRGKDRERAKARRRRDDCHYRAVPVHPRSDRPV